MKKNEINKKESENIYPYLEALSFFTNLIISESFSFNYANNNKNKKLPTNFNTLKNFIDYFIINNIYIKGENDPLLKEKIYLKENPEKIFYFLLNELHKIFKSNNDEVENKIIAVEYDYQKALKSFIEFEKNDSSYISDLFFGRKLIIKYCKNCKMTQYINKYLKIINLNVKNINSECTIEQLYSSLQKKFEKEALCEMCSSEQKIDFTIKIKKKPKILIFIITNNKKGIKINFPYYIFNKCYKLISVCIENNNKNIFGKLCKFRKKKYKIYYNKNSSKLINNNKNDFINENNLPKGNPYVLFYEKLKNDKIEIESLDEYDFTDMDLISKGNKLALFDTIPENKNSNKKIVNTNKKYNIIHKSNNKINNIDNQSFSNENLIQNKKDICLYFKFKENEKELFIDTDDCQIFFNIIEKLKEKYELNDESINENKIYYKNKKIDCQKTPKQLYIKDGSYIDFY